MRDEIAQSILTFILTTIVSAASIWYLLTIRVPETVETRPVIEIIDPIPALFSDIVVEWIFYEFPILGSIWLIFVTAIVMWYASIEILSYT